MDTAVEGYPGLTGHQLDHLVDEASRLLALRKLPGTRDRSFTLELGGDESLQVRVRPRGIYVEHVSSPVESLGAVRRRVRYVLAACYLDPAWWWWRHVVDILERLPDRGPVIDTTGD